MSNVFNRGGIINERKINIKGCCKQLLDTYNYQIDKNNWQNPFIKIKTKNNYSTKFTWNKE